jgi:hypothetical protein
VRRSNLRGTETTGRAYPVSATGRGRAVAYRGGATCAALIGVVAWHRRAHE